MPRIRTLKPEHRQHRKVGRFPDAIYRLWVSMILEADDHGRLVCDAGHLRAVTWPYFPKVSEVQVEEAIAAIAASGMVRLYVVNAVRYAEFISWRDHQRISHPLPPKLPEWRASGTFQNLPESSAVIPESSSLNGRELEVELEVELEGKGIGREGNTHSINGPPPVGGFACLWNLCPRKVNKATAERAYRKLAPDAALQATLCAALTAQQAWADRQGRFFPHLATWLNGQRWQDEPPAAALLTDKTAGNLDVGRRFVERYGRRPHDSR